MSGVSIKSVTPFDFRSDFEAPAHQAEAEKDRISISLPELAALLEDTRQSTAALVRDEQLKYQADAMRASAASFKTALAQIVQLAQTLENAAITENDRDNAMSQVRTIAAELIDGQGNLFQS